MRVGRQAVIVGRLDYQSAGRADFVSIGPRDIGASNGESNHGDSEADAEELPSFPRAIGTASRLEQLLRLADRQ